MKKPDIVRLVSERSGLTQNDANLALKALVKVIQEGLRKGESFSLSGLGSFRVKSRKARVGRNPKTGNIVPVPPGRKISFKPTCKLKKMI